MEEWTAPSVAAVLVIIVLVWLERRRRESKRDRTSEIRQASSALNMGFRASDEGVAKESFFQSTLFQRGDSKSVANVLRGSVGNREVIVFDYEYFLSSGRTTTCCDQTVAAHRLGVGTLPDFVLSPEGTFLWLGKVFGAQDFDFKDHREFSQSYRLRGPDESAIRELFAPDVLRYFALETGWSLEAGGEWLLIFRDSQLVVPQQIHSFISKTEEIAHRLADE